MIWRRPGEELAAGAACCGSWVKQRFGTKCVVFQRSWRLATLDFCRLPKGSKVIPIGAIMPQTWGKHDVFEGPGKLRETHDLERSGRKVGGGGAALVWPRQNSYLARNVWFC